jgi:hypothetical protein
MRWEWLGRCLRILILANFLRIFLLLELFGLCGLLAALLGRLGRGNVLVVRGLYIAESGCRRASVCTVQARVGMYSTGARRYVQYRRSGRNGAMAQREWDGSRGMAKLARGMLRDVLRGNGRRGVVGVAWELN